MYSFFAYMNRMKYIERWSLMHSISRENIAEHSQQVASIAHALAVIGNIYFNKTIDCGKVTICALYHEASEVLTGDLPTPIKYYNPKIKTAYKEIEKVATDKLVSMLPELMQSYYNDILNYKDEIYDFVKAADKLSAYVKCIEEIKCGNSEFVKAKKTIEMSIEENLMPEVKFFKENFIEAYEKTLDELE